MEGQEIPPRAAEKDTLRVEEFKLLQAETLQRLRMQGFLSTANLVLLFASVVTFKSLSVFSTPSLIATSCVLWIVLLVFVEEDYNITLVARYIKRHVYRSAGVSPSARGTYWEWFRGEAIRKAPVVIQAIMLVKYGAFFVPMVILDWFIVEHWGSPVGWLIFYGCFVGVKFVITVLGWFALGRSYGVIGSGILE